MSWRVTCAVLVTLQCGVVPGVMSQACLGCLCCKQARWERAASRSGQGIARLDILSIPTNFKRARNSASRPKQQSLAEQTLSGHIWTYLDILDLEAKTSRPPRQAEISSANKAPEPGKQSWYPQKQAQTSCQAFVIVTFPKRMLSANLWKI